MMEKPAFCRLFFFVFTKPDKYGIILMYELFTLISDKAII